jgi:hypothetical protein
MAQFIISENKVLRDGQHVATLDEHGGVAMVEGAEKHAGMVADVVRLHRLKPPEKASDPDECPKCDHRGDKTPGVFEWMCKHQTKEAKARYIGRVLMGKLITEKLINQIAKS